MTRDQFRSADLTRVRHAIAGRRPGWRCQPGVTAPHGARPAELARVRGLVIPPAWSDVWICARPTGHLQAVGTDAAGCRQYLYHPQFRAQQEQAKRSHVLDVAEALPRVRETAERHLDERGLTRPRVLAAAVRLLDLGFFRIGSDRYAELNDSFGLTTLRRDHSRCRAGAVLFAYTGKHGREIAQTVADPGVCRDCAEVQRVFAGGVLGEIGEPQPVRAGGDEVTAEEVVVHRRGGLLDPVAVLAEGAPPVIAPADPPRGPVRHAGSAGGQASGSCTRA
ncbi:hypothetical protein [Streptomyces sp. ASQP_92]|uniref:hypothetical protein n=1 Tax=Streptomyces sp. ASQP_92 TaxID=2979116 RepID=UPI0037D9CF24